MSVLPPVSGFRQKSPLQPLVENAIYHGLKYKDSKGLLTVHGYMKGENAVIDITDDGVGMDGSAFISNSSLSL